MIQQTYLFQFWVQITVRLTVPDSDSNIEEYCTYEVLEENYYPKEMNNTHTAYNIDVSFRE